MDLKVNGAVYLEGEVPDGLDHLLAPGVRLLFGATRIIRSPPSTPYFTIRDTTWEESKPEREM